MSSDMFFGEAMALPLEIENRALRKRVADLEVEAEQLKAGARRTIDHLVARLEALEAVPSNSEGKVTE